MSVLKIISAYPELFNTDNRTYTKLEAIQLIASCKSRGSDIQKASFRIHDLYLCICKLFKLGLREPAVALSKNLLDTAVWYQEYHIAAELAKYLVNHYAIYGSQITSKEYMELYKKYNSMSDLEFRARQVFNKVCYNHDHHLETNKEKIENALQQIEALMLLDSMNYHLYYYKSKCILSKGKELLTWANKAIAYFEDQYFMHNGIISHFKSMLVQYYINIDSLEEAFSILNNAIQDVSEGSYAWFKYMYSYIELLVKQGRLKEAGENFEIATNHEVFASLAEDDRRYWEVLREMIYDSENVSYSMKS